MYTSSLNKIVPKRYENASLAKILYHPKIVEAIYNWVELNKYFLIVSGKPGSGKTYLSWAIHYHWEYKFEKFKIKVKERYQKDANGGPFEMPFIPPLCIRHYEENDFLCEIRSRMMGGSDYQYVIKSMCEADYFILDDFGTSQITDWQKEVFFNFVNDRMKTKLPTIIISNLSEFEIKKIYSDRVYTRLFAAENTIVDVGETNLREIFNQEEGGRFSEEKFNMAKKKESDLSNFKPIQ